VVGTACQPPGHAGTSGTPLAALTMAHAATLAPVRAAHDTRSTRGVTSASPRGRPTVCLAHAARVGCQGRSCAEVVQPHACSPCLLAALLVPWPEQSTHFSDTGGAEAPGIHEERPSMCLAPCPHRLVPRHRSALECLAASLMSTASPASTTSRTEGGTTRHGRGGPWPCRTRATGLWEHGEDAHVLSGARTGHPAARLPMACRAGATGPLLWVCPHLRAPRATPTRPPDRVDRGGVVRQQHPRPLRAGIPWAAAPAHRSRARPRACALLSPLPPSPPGWQVWRHGQSWEPRVLERTSRSLPCVPSVHQACRPVPLY
jgi:hypothetical protein